VISGGFFFSAQKPRIAYAICDSVTPDKSFAAASGARVNLRFHPDLLRPRGRSAISLNPFPACKIYH